jgi:hypothetical protein
MGPERDPGQRQACTRGSGAPLRGAVYRPRKPRASPLWQCAQRHGKELREAVGFQRAVEEHAIERFIECDCRTEVTPRNSRGAGKSLPYSRGWNRLLGN